ncbi:MAG: T9SS type A sorting domain-containing protein [Candidatus Cloacimonetes bacterium]|nr:T9SS type A sorting domain-containing protein [Candidatus Cloacimonadota bacterium]
MQRKKLLTVVLLLLFLTLLSADKIALRKAEPQPQRERRIHPVQQYFEKQPPRVNRTLRPGTENRLLVMMIDFQKDADTSTTGNGKFLKDAGDYLLDLGKPPHDQEYYWWVLESVRYYYEAASLGAYDLEFDIYPQYEYTEADTAIIAYTLPHEMSYYTPPGADTDLMISRFEEYFRDVFITVDADTTVDFSSYGHFMFLHAGADSQHDIRGDSSSDIPSFFIQIGEGKEVTVDGVVIDHACNVPETISQDGQYGVPNGVIAHEFGHSLGFADLYSTLTGAPQVGWFDIMDSGGMGELVVMEIDGELITLEGGLPTLPSAWHRVLAWEDYLRNNKMLVDISELDWSQPIRIDPAEKLYEGGRVEYPYFIKVPLTDKEYLLIENRQVDPDGDSGLNFKGALPQNPNSTIDKKYRVLWYPTYPAPDPRDTPNWEYDLFLPGWQNTGDDGRIYNYGGGLVIWHIDDGIIYEEGEWEGDEFYSNYAMNTVNALHTHRGVKVIEADGFDNIGNYNDSYNILGSAWDPFFRYQPVLTKNGEFVRWADQGIAINVILSNEDEFIHTVDFNGISIPAMMTNDGDPSFLGLSEISSYNINPGMERYMSFRYGCQAYDEISILRNYDTLNAISRPGIVYQYPSLAVLADENIELLTRIGNEWNNSYDVIYNWAHEITQPTVSYDYDSDGNNEFVLVSDNILAIVNELDVSEEEYPAAFSDAPMFLPTGQTIYPLADRLMINELELTIAGAKVAWDGEYLIAQTSDRLYYVDMVSADIQVEYLLPESNIAYYPQIFRDLEGNTTCYTASENGSIRRYNLNGEEEIFNSSDYNKAAPSQIILTPLVYNGAVRMVFAAGEKLFALTLEGSLETGYPILLENRAITAGSNIQSLHLSNNIILMLQRETGGKLAVDTAGSYHQEYSSILPSGGIIPQYWHDADTESLNWFGGDESGALYNALLYDHINNPLINCGWRQNDFGIFIGKAWDALPDEQEFSAYAYPNPSREGYARFRVTGAPADISLKLYDIAGNLVYKTNKLKETGEYQDIRLDTSSLASGVYYARISSASKMLTTALGIVK